MSVIQLNPPIPVLTPLGTAQAFFLWTEFEQDIVYGCFQDETGENWWWPNHRIRLQGNITRQHPSVTQPDDMEGLDQHRHRYVRKGRPR